MSMITTVFSIFLLQPGNWDGVIEQKISKIWQEECSLVEGGILQGSEIKVIYDSHVTQKIEDIDNIFTFRNGDIVRIPLDGENKGSRLSPSCR